MLTLLAILMVPQDQVPAVVKKAELTLASTPEDPAANLVVGKYLAFFRGLYDQAMPHLAKSSDEFLSEVAKRELAGADPVSIGNDWWKGSAEVEVKVMEGLKGISTVSAKKDLASVRGAMKERALHWYAKAWPGIQAPAEREALRAKVLGFLRSPVGKVGALPKQFHDMPGVKNPKGSGADSSLARGRVSLKVAPGASLRAGEFPASPDSKIVLSCYVLSNGTDSLKDTVRVRFFSKKGGITHVGKFATSDHPFWTKLEVEIVAPAGTDHIDLNVFSESTKGELWVDDLSLKIDGKEALQAGSFE